MTDEAEDGAFDSMSKMSGRMPQPTSALATGQRSSSAAGPVVQGGAPHVTGNAVALARATAAANAAPGSAARQSPLNKHVCPFCGMKRDDPTAICPGCGLADNEDTRGATVARVGPWFVLQPRNPSAPGMRFMVLRELVRTGQVTAGSIVRGPCTHQLWTYAARVRGLAHLFGVCWSCNRRLPMPQPGEEPDEFCVYCGAMQTPPTNPDQQLEALGTSEAIGTGVSSLAGQVASALAGTPASNPARIQARETAGPTTAHMARRPNLPRPLPPAPRDGSDALLTTRELATAFNLDRKRNVLATVGKVPWFKLVLVIAAVALVGLGLWLAAKVLLEPLTGMNFQF